MPKDKYMKKKMMKKKMMKKKMMKSGGMLRAQDTIRTVYPQMAKYTAMEPNPMGSGPMLEKSLATADTYVKAKISGNYRMRYNKQSSNSFQLIQR